MEKSECLITVRFFIHRKYKQAQRGNCAFHLNVLNLTSVRGRLLTSRCPGGCPWQTLNLGPAWRVILGAGISVSQAWVLTTASKCGTEQQTPPFPVENPCKREP